MAEEGYFWDNFFILLWNGQEGPVKCLKEAYVENCF